MQEGVGHPAADDQQVDLADEVAQNFHLGRNLGPADHGGDRMLRRFQSFGQGVQLGLHQPPGGGGQDAGDGLGRGMGPVRNGKGVVDVEIAQGGQLLGEARVVLFFLGVEAQVFQNADVAVVKVLDDCFSRSADAIGGEGDGAVQNLGQGVGDRLQAHLRDDLAFGATEVRQHADPGPGGGQIGQGFRRALQARGVGHFTVLHRHVQVATDQNGLSPDIKVVDGLELAHVGDPLAGFF